ncbi:hypothetical protein HQN90_06170 [Paenibacillus alba]|uniref:hypothetical protein n=1 Tax=Paenibacillus alba TaxID=1197127 RepID=UPI0015664585|nr:hypothetical protein [Paenibacillus alba]NQX65707.1 hypothetical protein [Paenibacillus alba]
MTTDLLNRQIRESAARGWAEDKDYADKLINRLDGKKLQGYVLEEVPEVDKGVANTIYALTFCKYLPKIPHWPNWLAGDFWVSFYFVLNQTPPVPSFSLA